MLTPHGLVDRPYVRIPQVDKEWDELMRQARYKMLGLGKDGKHVTGFEIAYQQEPTEVQKIVADIVKIIDEESQRG